MSLNVSETEKKERFVHKFEESGLGCAPFTLIDVTRGENWYACDYCSTAIKERCFIRDCNGKFFVVGNECVMSTGDAGLIDTVKRASREARRTSRHRREATIIAAGRGILENPEVKQLLALKPHPSQSFADEGKSLLDYVNFMFDAAGNKGKMQTVELLCKFQGVKATADDEADYEVWQRQIRRRSQAKAEQSQIENADLIAVFESRPASDFISSMLEKLRNAPLGELSDRQYQIVADIFARSFGSPRSRKYNEALAGLAERRRLSRSD